MVRICNSHRVCYKSILLLFISLVLSPVSAFAGRIYVDADAASGGNGQAWETAYKYLADALGAAASGDEIWVAEGVYYPDEGSGRTDNGRYQYFTMKNGVAIYGGFAGGETDLSQRDWHTYKAILSADIDKNDTDTDGNKIAETWADLQGSNADGVVEAPGGLTSSARLDGFTVTGGSADSQGGGIWCGTGSSASFYNLEVRGNQAYNYGGGMCNWGASPHVEDCLFDGNRTTRADGLSMGGGGMHLDGSSASVIRVTFSNNWSNNFGGGLSGAGGGSPTLTDLTFTNNGADFYGGAMNFWDMGNITLTNPTVVENEAEIGGGIYMFRGGALNITRGTFRENRSVSGSSGSKGGAICIAGDIDLNATGATFVGNTAASIGGAISSEGAYWGEGVPPGYAVLNLVNCIFVGNNGSWGGGGIYNASFSNVTITNCSFSGNQATNGGAIANHGASWQSGCPNPSSVVITNSIAWGNSSSINTQSCSPTTVTYSDIEGGFVGDGNINLDPLFVTPATLPAPTTVGDLHLQTGSPAIDTGTETGAPATDLEGVARPFDGDSDGTAATDMGAYELASFEVTASAGEHGSLDASTPSPQTVAVVGEIVSFKFNADAGYHVATVSGCGGAAYANSSESVSTYTYTTGAITASCTVTAVFAINLPIEVFFAAPDNRLFNLRTNASASDAVVSLLPGEGSSSRSPAVAIFNDRQYIAIKGATDSSIYIKSRARNGSFSDSSWELIPGTTSSSPALCVFNSHLYLFVKGTTSNRLFYRSMDTSGTWSSWLAVSDSNTLWRPGLVAFGGRLYCFEADATTNRLWYKSMDATGSWGDWVMIPTGTTNAGPTPTTSGDKIWLFVKGVAGKMLFWSATATPETPTSWSGWASCNGSSEAAPGVALEPNGNLFHLAVRGNMVPRIWHRTLDPGTLVWGNWHLVTSLDPSAESIDSPTVAPTNW